MMTLRPAIRTIPIALALLLSGCAGGTAPAPGESVPATNTATAPTGGGSACPDLPDYQVFSGPDVLVAPADGAIFGDGTPIEWTLGFDETVYPGIDIVYVDHDGEPRVDTGMFLEDLGGGRYGTDLLLFGDDQNGQPGFMTLTIVENAGIEDGVLVGDTIVLGVYCVSLRSS